MKTMLQEQERADDVRIPFSPSMRAAAITIVLASESHAPLSPRVPDARFNW